MPYRRSHAHIVIGALTTAAAIGVNVAVFALVNALWLRPQPLHDSGSLVVVTRADQVADPSRWTDLGLNHLASTGLFSGVAGEVVTRDLFLDIRPRIVLAPVGREVETIAVTPEYFSVLGAPVLGRTFESTDLSGHGPSVAIISERLFRTGSGDPGV